MEIYLKLQLTNLNCMEAWILRISNCFDKATKQQKRKIWQNKKTCNKFKGKNWKLILQSQFCWQLQLKNQDYRKFEDQNHWKLKDWNCWKLQVKNQNHWKNDKIKIAKSCCRSVWRANHAWKQCKECINNNTMQKNENRNMMWRMKIKRWKSLWQRRRNTLKLHICLKKKYKKKTKTLTQAPYMNLKR
jgi:hypothetical protein